MRVGSQSHHLRSSSVAGGRRVGAAEHHRIGMCVEREGMDGPHGEGTNIALSDGHVKRTKIQSIPNEDDDARAIWVRVQWTRHTEVAHEAMGHMRTGGLRL